MKKAGAGEEIRSSRCGRSLITIDCSGPPVEAAVSAAKGGVHLARDTRATTDVDAAVPAAKILDATRVQP